MKKILTSLVLLLAVSLQAQTITVNGIPVLVSSDTSFPFWLESGSSISPEPPVFTISILEFNIVSNPNGNDMVFNQVISVTEGQTVPDGKTWKVESVLMENQGFDSENINNLQSDIMFVENSNGLIHLKIDSNVTFTESKAIIVSEILPTGGEDVIESGICFSSHTANPTVLDNIIRGPISSQTGVFNSEIDLYNSDTTLYVRAFATNLNGVSYSEAINYSLPEYYVGKEYQGGIIFYMDETVEHGLIAAMGDLGNFPFSPCANINVGNQNAIGTGNQNSLEIVSACSQTTAASEALAYESNGYEDWYLPSYDELSEMYNVIGRGSLLGNIGGFVHNWYWSSSWFDGTAHNINFSNGSVNYNVTEGFAFPIRAIRSF